MFDIFIAFLCYVDIPNFMKGVSDMKKKYFSPFAEKIEFDYFNQIVASGGSNCYQTVLYVVPSGSRQCESGDPDPQYQWHNNTSY